MKTNSVCMCLCNTGTLWRLVEIVKRQKGLFLEVRMWNEEGMEKNVKAKDDKDEEGQRS